MLKKGDTWNESKTHTDPVTGRTVRRMTTEGQLNTKGPYHTRTTFTDDSEFIIIGSYRDGCSMLLRAHVATGDLTVLTDPIASDDICLHPNTVAPVSGWLVYWEDRVIKGVNVYTLEERIILDDLDNEWRGAMMSVHPDEKSLLTPLVPRTPDEINNVPKELHKPVYYDYFPGGEGMKTRLLEVPMEGGSGRVVHEDAGMRMCHLEHSPVDGDLVYIDRDLPPMYHSGGDYSKTSRCWTLRLSTGELTALPPRAYAKFQIHAAWSWCGEFLYYHGPAAFVWGPCPWYVGAVRPNGEIYREWTFEHGRHYGHVAAAPDRPAIILDGNVTPNQLNWLYLDSDAPRIEPICEHNTELNSIKNNQLSHAHPSTDRQGKWIGFNVAKDKRTDVWVVTV